MRTLSSSGRAGGSRLSWPTLAAIALSALAPASAGAEPFLAVPRLPIELRRSSAAPLIEPAGWELTGPGAARWGLSAATSEVGIHGLCASGALAMVGLRAQLSASDFGVPFYRETRLSAALVRPAPITPGVVLDARSVSMDGFPSRSGLGVGWIVRGNIRNASFLVAAFPSARAGEAMLFPTGWSVAIGAGTAGAVSVLVEGRSARVPRIVLHNRWHFARAALGLAVDVTQGTIRIGIGLDGGVLSALAGASHDRHLGWVREISLLDRERS